jgi:hypothetical protein
MQSLPGSQLPNTSGLSSLSQTASGLQTTADKLKQNAETFADGALTPEAPSSMPKPGSAAQLDSVSFLNRAQQGGVASSKQGGVSLTVNGSASANMPFLDAPNIGKDLANVPDVRLNGGGQVDLRFTSREKTNGSGFYLGLRGDLSAMGSTQGVTDAARTGSDLASRADALQSRMSGLQDRMNGLATKLQNSPGYQRMEQLAGQISSNPASANPAMLGELRQILNSGEIQGLLGDMNQSLGEINGLLGDASGALGALGDGKRQVSGEAAVRGAAEIYGGYRTPGIELGDSRWKARFGVEASAIVPLPAPAQPDNDLGLPKFKYAMAKVAATAQITTQGLGDIQNRLGQLQSNLSGLQSALSSTSSAVDSAAAAANQGNPSNPIAMATQLGQIQQTITSLNQAATQASSAGQQLNTNLDGLADDIGKASMKTSLGLTTITPTAPVGFGIRDIGVDLYGPITEKVHANIEAGVMNPVGYLQGEESQYQMEKSGEGKYHLNHTSTKQRNVFHDFYDPAVYAGVGVTANADSPFRTDLKIRAEHSLSSDTLRGSAIVRQQTGPVSFSTGVLNTDLRNAAPNMYMVGVGIGKGDIFSVQAATDSFSPDKAANVQVQAGFKVPF